MKIAIASDHAGVEVKKQVIDYAKTLGFEMDDFGPKTLDAVDYPDYAFKVGEAVAAGQYQRGILICGTGLGMCIAANKVPGVRAVSCYDEFTAEMSRRHNNSNVLCLGARTLKPEKILLIVKIWLETEFESGAGKSRHHIRVQKISDYERQKNH